MILMICMNVGLGAVAQIPDQPLSIDNNCYYNSNLNDVSQFDSSNLEDIRDEILQPTNMTSSGEGDGLPLNNFTNPIESAARQLEIILSFFTGGYVINTVANVTLGCTVTCDQALVDGKCAVGNGANFVYTPNTPLAMWQTFSAAFQIIVIVLLLTTIVHLLRGSTLFSPHS